MLTVNRRHSIHKQFQATRDRQICRAWRVERHDKTGRQHRSARWVLAITGLRKPTCTGRMIKKCSLAVIGKVSAPASRIQEYVFPEPDMDSPDFDWNDFIPDIVEGDALEGAEKIKRKRPWVVRAKNKGTATYGYSKKAMIRLMKWAGELSPSNKI
ncbi:hypothetical protein RVM27_16590 [Halomonas sp. KM007]